MVMVNACYKIKKHPKEQLLNEACLPFANPKLVKNNTYLEANWLRFIRVFDLFSNYSYSQTSYSKSFWISNEKERLAYMSSSESNTLLNQP